VVGQILPLLVKPQQTFNLVGSGGRGSIVRIQIDDLP
jgi:hypothetical protein